MFFKRTQFLFQPFLKKQHIYNFYRNIKLYKKRIPHKSFFSKKKKRSFFKVLKKVHKKKGVLILKTSKKNFRKKL